MAYTQVGWENLPTTTTPVNKTNLKHMDDGIKNNDDNISALASNFESGIFTPTIQGRTTAGTATYTIRNGHYVKIGKVIFYEFQIGCTLTGSAGVIYITGMPNLANAYEPSLGHVTVSPSFDSAKPLLELRKYYDGFLMDYGNLGNVGDQNWSSTKYIYGTGFYILQ